MIPLYNVEEYDAITSNLLCIFLYLGYKTEKKFPCVIKEEVCEEVPSHKSLRGGRKLELLSLQTILVTVFLYLLLLPLHVYNVCIYIYTIYIQ